ncbi:hypothetical protein [Radiobacillus sp. PE A8.2]|uniref:hypothetical protein n=1 Tax=Radiobacillus sp. PE A8.2 TaxID=3380349 RepID=UPI0038903345
MTDRTVYCTKCLKEIRVRDDLVTATSFFIVDPYHTACYAEDLKGAKTLFLSNEPINGFAGNFVTIVALLAFIVILLIYDSPFKWLSAAALIVVGYRIYSYIVFERHIEK